MSSLRLQGHSFGNARERLYGAENSSAEKKPTDNNSAHSFEMTSINSHGEHHGHFWDHWSHRRKVVTSLLSAVLVVGVVAGSFLAFHHKKSAPVVVKKQAVKVQASPQPTTVASPLSGLQVAPELAARPATGIMIENSIDARPQSGLQDAGVVFEAVAEGGITRFLALFQDTSPAYVGPVRSLRPYYIDWASAFDASIAHVGGSPDALAQIRSGGKDLDQFFNSGAYWRVGSRRAPHNVYTSLAKLDELNAKKGYKSQYNPWERKAEGKLPTPTAKTINMNLSGALYNVHYDYEAASNSYIRSEGGRPHVATTSEADSVGTQLKPKVVIGLVMSYSTSGKYSVYGTSGSGTMFVFQDGGWSQGTWTKPDRKSQFIFKDSAGNPLKLNPGQTWVTGLAAANRVTYAP